MMRMTTKFVNDGSDVSGSVSETIRLVERSKAEKTMELSLTKRFFIPSGFHLLEKLSLSSLFDSSFSVVISDSENFTFIRALTTRFLL